jgi:hypothetical protein
MSELSSNNKDGSAVSPKLKIKVGQVKEKQTFSLNASMSGSVDGYYKTVKDFKSAGYSESEVRGLNDFVNVAKIRDDKAAFAGNFLNDDALTRRYTTRNLGERINEYISNLDYSVGASKGNTITERRMPGRLIDEHNDMGYSPDNVPQSAAQGSLFSTLMNEAVSIATHAGVGSDVVGTKSMATDAQSETIQAMRAIGEAMNDAVIRIYGGTELTSMAVQGLTDQERAVIAENSFEAYIQSLEKSAATEDPLMKEFLRNYRVVQNEQSQQEERKNSTVSNLND